MSLLLYDSNKYLSNQFLNNIILESHLVHARNILEFFFPTNGKHRKYKTIVASSYLSETYTVTKCQMVDDFRDIISQTCDHITERRFVDSIFQKERSEMILEMFPILQEYIINWLTFIKTTNVLLRDYQSFFSEAFSDIELFIMNIKAQRLLRA